MIVTEYLNGETLIRHYSDKGVLLLQNETGVKYADPIDVVPCRYTYTETDEPIESTDESDEATEAYYQDALRNMGVPV
jgi:hypothetical protein